MADLGRLTLGSAGFHAGTRRWSTLEAFAGTAAPQAGKRSLPPSGRIGRVDPAPLHGARAQARAPLSLPAWGFGNLELDSPGTFRAPKQSGTGATTNSRFSVVQYHFVRSAVVGYHFVRQQQVETG